MRVLTVANRRGGVGKTCTAHAIGARLALLGKKVLFIDLDSQCNLTFDLRGHSGSTGALEMLTRAATAGQVIQHPEGAAGDLIPATPNLAAADLLLTGKGKEYRLAEALRPISGLYDYCIIDTPPALNMLTTNALAACEGVVIPAAAEVHSLQGLGLLHETIKEVQRYCNPALKVYGIVLTRYKGQTVHTQDMRENLRQAAQELGIKLYATAIRESIAVSEAETMQRDIYSYVQDSAPRSRAAEDYTAFTDELLRDLEEV